MICESHTKYSHKYKNTAELHRGLRSLWYQKIILELILNCRSLLDIQKSNSQATTLCTESEKLDLHHNVGNIKRIILVFLWLVTEHSHSFLNKQSSYLFGVFLKIVGWILLNHVATTQRLCFLINKELNFHKNDLNFEHSYG